MLIGAKHHEHRHAEGTTTNTLIKPKSTGWQHPPYALPHGHIHTLKQVVNILDIPRGTACIRKFREVLTSVENSQGTVKRHHSAHLAPAVAYESWLHSTAKLILGERIHDAIANILQEEEPERLNRDFLATLSVSVQHC